MTRNLHTPSAGEPVSAAWARGVVEDLRALRLQALPPLMLTRTPSGTTLRVASGPSAPAALPQAWDLSVDGATAACRRCLLMLSSVVAVPEGFTPTTWMAETLTATLSGSSGWLCARLHTGTKAIALVFADPPTEPDPDSEYMYVPLYFMAASAAGAWSVAADVRAAPVAVGYV